MNNLEPLKFGVSRIANILRKYNYKVKQGNILAGPIIGLERTYTLMDLGLGVASYLHRTEIFISKKTHHPQVLTPNKIGEFIILKHRLEKKKTTVSLCKLNYGQKLEQLKQIDLDHMHLYTQYRYRVRSGMVVDFDGLQIFVPNYHLSKFYKRFRYKNKKRPCDWLQIQVLEVRRKMQGTPLILGNLKLSKFKDYRPFLWVGLTQVATILKVKKYGLFCNLYGVKCLLHISELARPRAKRISSVYQPGQQIPLQILYVDTSEGKVALSNKTTYKLAQ